MPGTCSTTEPQAQGMRGTMTSLCGPKVSRYLKYQLNERTIKDEMKREALKTSVICQQTEGIMVRDVVL